MIEMHFCSAKVRTSLIVWLSTNHKNFKIFWKHSNQVSFRSVCIVYIIKQNILLQFKSPKIVMMDITMNGWSFCKLASCQMEHEARLIDGFVIACYPRLKRNRPGQTYSKDFLFPEFNSLWNPVPDCKILMIWFASFYQAIWSIIRGDIYLANLQLFCFRVMADGFVLII